MTQGTVQRDNIYVYGICVACNEDNVLVYEFDNQLLCASDYRKVVRKIRYTQPCDKCGSGSSFRDPNHRRNEYLCGSCHKENGFHVNNSVIKRALVSLTSQAKKLGTRPVCYAAGYGSDCDDNVKPRGPWDGKSLCDKHGKIPPKPKKS